MSNILKSVKHAVGIVGLAGSLQAGAAPTWQVFEWLETEVVPGAGVVKSSVILPIKVNGVDCYAQLDTGAPNTLIWHQPATTEQPLKEFDIEIAGRHQLVKGSSVQLDILRACKKALIATIGNAFFDDGTLTLDLKNARFSFSSGSTLEREPLSHPFAYPRWSGYEGGHIIVQLVLPNGQEGDVLFDTGAASFGLSALTENDWRMMTDNVPLRASATVRAYSVNSWGKQIPCFDTTLPGNLQIIPGLSIANSRIAYCAQESFKPGQKLVALLGLRDLSDRVVTLDYPARRWMISQ
ncbi:hypothetical protein ACFFKC_11060 [Pseudoduganella danionis]|uniref:Peptidase A2 domain-containing protein n=1 Tax=Pseudoduganella danionis TaxID=1890295 RepID=A0ABW9SKB9_9BURK|nr:hypothetical protein [Pseudoduganella danionis]MTW32440.1 hypothetical protein [Pseudoduganella danionis]